MTPNSLRFLAFFDKPQTALCQFQKVAKAVQYFSSNLSVSWRKCAEQIPVKIVCWFGRNVLVKISSINSISVLWKMTSIRTVNSCVIKFKTRFSSCQEYCMMGVLDFLFGVIECHFSWQKAYHTFLVSCTQLSPFEYFYLKTHSFFANVLKWEWKRTKVIKSNLNCFVSYYLSILFCERFRLKKWRNILLRDFIYFIQNRHEWYKYMYMIIREITP